MVRVTTQVLEAHVITEGDWIAVTEICQLCRIEPDAVRELGELGVVLAARDAGGGWQVPAAALPRLRIVGRLMRDLGVNVSGAALAVELLEAQRALERRLRDLESLARRSLSESSRRLCAAIRLPPACRCAPAAALRCGKRPNCSMMAR